MTSTLVLVTSAPAHRTHRGPWTVALALVLLVVAATAYFGVLGELLNSLAFAS